jgi:anti-anti-sigma factor
VAISEELAEGHEPSTHVAGDVQVFYDDDGTLIVLSGEVDLALGPELADAGRLATTRAQPVRVDLTQVSFIDSVGVGFLARMAALERAAGSALLLIGASRRVRETVQLVGLDAVVRYGD